MSTTRHPGAPGPLESPDEVVRGLGDVGYVIDRASATVVFLALRLERPLLVEGPAGVGKTELAKALSLVLGRDLVRLQCYEGLDEAKALYEWEYSKQLLYTQILRDHLAGMLEGAGGLAAAVERVASQDAAFYSERFLLPRPLLAAIRSERPTVLLIDEVDRSDPEFEAFLLEVLSDFQVSIPELGTLVARHRPLAVLTSNATRDVTEALRRRCLYLVLDYPDPEREAAIVRLKVPGMPEALAASLVSFVQRVRALDLAKRPSISETLDWARALCLLGAASLDAELVRETLGILLKNREDTARALAQVPKLLA
ncbi:MAG: MoxR family ATPase [Deltaproteobacteria bacterium]|nr:MoxR family ATPase [Deltaproteobacteria bacterium]